MSAMRPTTLTIAALGGQGGGVVAGWMTDVARREGWLVQATSVPGVAQRTGATIYYLEFFPEALLPADGRRPVMALMPTPGDVDVVLASELAEAGRMILRGLVTPDRTRLIASTHRVYAIGEKIHPGDARADPGRLLDAARSASRELVAFDMAALAESRRAVVSAVMLGAMAGSGALPFAREAYREAIRGTGKDVERNLGAFEAGADAAAAALARAGDPAGTSPEGTDAVALPLRDEALCARVAAEIPAVLRPLVGHAAARLVDYQDVRHAHDYLDRLGRVLALDERRDQPGSLSEAVSRGLALWMSVEDTIRVADLKTRASRAARLARTARASRDELVTVTEFLRPGVAEICGTLPRALGARILASERLRRSLERFTSGRRVRTSTVTGFLTLRALASLRRWRRGTLRFDEENCHIEDWLGRLGRLVAVDYAAAVELARAQLLVRGYGETFERGLCKFGLVSQAAEMLAGRPDAAVRLAELRGIAMSIDAVEPLRTAVEKAAVQP